MPTTPNVNASLIREIRMIAQQLFRHKNLSKSEKTAPAPVLRCGECMKVTSRLIPAVTIYNGTAVCLNHVSITMAPRNRA